MGRHHESSGGRSQWVDTMSRQGDVLTGSTPRAVRGTFSMGRHHESSGGRSQWVDTMSRQGDVLTGSTP